MVNLAPRGYAAPQMADAADTGAQEVLPPYVVSDADRERWANAETEARNLLGPDAPEDAIWSMRRSIYHNRDGLPD